MKGLGIGRIVHFVMTNGEHRPATIVRVWDKSTGYVNLQVFTDGENDGEDNTIWRSSVNYSEDFRVYSWHWPEFVE